PVCFRDRHDSKKNGDWRMCIDYRPLNKFTITDKYPLPKLSELIRSLKDSKFFVALDLRGGCWQIPMADNSIQYTAFRTSTGLYEFKVMPFGLTNAPATFQRSMNFLLDDLRYSGVLVYLDDILIHAPTLQELLQLVDEVFERLLRAGYTINLEKCQFLPTTLLYLGHIIEEGTIRPNPKKIEAIQRLQAPTTTQGIRSLLGMTGFLQAFIPNYSEIAAPITDLLKGTPNRTKKIVTIKWTSRCEDALNRLKELVIDAVLAQPLDADKYLLEVDASSYAIGGVLKLSRANEWLPVHYISRKLNTTEQNWPIREKEAFAIIYC
ncbi:putative enzymatic polyprotein, partial [Gregarina niphandrodes]